MSQWIGRGLFSMSGVALAVVGVSDEHMSLLAAIGVIVAGYAWIAWRIERIVRREMRAHTAAETEWRTALEEKIDLMLERKR